MFKIYIGLEEKGTFGTFAEAVAEFVVKVKEFLKGKDGISFQVLETANYIEHDVFVPSQNETVTCVLYFSDTRDIAHRLGIMKEGYVVENPPDVSPLLIDMIFLTIFTVSMEKRKEIFDEMKARFQKGLNSPDNGSQIVYLAKIIER